MNTRDPILQVYPDLFGEGWVAEYDGLQAWDECPIRAVAAVLEEFNRA